MARKIRKHDLYFLAGWLFADMFVVLTVIFLASTTLKPPPPPPTPTPTPVHQALRKDSIDLILTTNATRLLNDDRATRAAIEQQVKGQLQQKHATQFKAGLVLIFGGGLDDFQDTQIAQATEKILIGLGKQNIVFNPDTVYRDYVDRGSLLGTIKLNIFVFG